jgi:site-specific recombinase XerD
MPKKKECSFLLKQTKATTPTPINFHMTCPDGDVKRSIGKKILPPDWSFEHQRAAGNSKPAREINQLIDAIAQVLPGIKSECQRNGRVISCVDVHNALDVILQDKRPDTPKGRDMFDDFREIIQQMKGGKVLTPGKDKKRYSPESINNFDKAVRKLELFYLGNKRGTAYEQVTMETYSAFISWCHKDNQSNNSIGYYIKSWKRLGKIALAKGWHSNLVFNNKEFLILKEETPDIYLDESKIERIYKQQVVIKQCQIARDWFVLDCFLGLRASDLQRISIKDFQGKHFQFINQKTGAHVTIPIHRNVKAIIKKWKGLPPEMSDDLMNEYIKIVAKMAALKDKFSYTITKGGKLQVHELEEWQMVSNHTCRRSFITNLLKMGIPHAQVMRLAGIKRYETLMRYFKQTADEAAHEVGQHKFFKGR